MRVMIVVAMLGGGSVAAAEPRWSVGLRTTWNSQLAPPPWLLTGGQWGVRVGRGTWLVLDADGGRGAVIEQHDLLDAAASRTMIAAGLGLARDVWTRGRNAVRLLAGVGEAWEMAHVRELGMWVDGDETVRPFAFAGAALEHHFIVDATDHGVIGLEVRGVRLAGEGPMSNAPPLAPWSAQATLELTAYF